MTFQRTIYHEFFFLIHRYIPDAIETKVNYDPFVVVIKDIENESGCSRMCDSLVEKMCQRLQNRSVKLVESTFSVVKKKKIKFCLLVVFIV